MVVTPAPRVILVVEDEGLYRELLCRAFDEAGFVSVPAGTASDAAKLFRLHDPDCAVIDLDLGAGPNGLFLAARLRADSPNLPLVFLTVHKDPRAVDGPPAPRDSRFINKAEVRNVSSLIDVVEEALRGSRRVTRHDESAVNPLRDLTPAQVEILRLISQGMTNKQIAQARGTSLRAVEQIIHRTLGRSRVSSAEGNRRVLASRLLEGKLEGLA